jgi:radical SAM superfamily enzyme YgiQ (UPF0313 family)
MAGGDFPAAVARAARALVVSTRPRVLLVNPRITSRRRARFPLSLLALAAQLEEHYDCKIIDGNIDNAASQVIDILSSEPCAAVGLTVMGGPQVRPAIEVSTAVRALSPHTPIIWGGYFPSLYPDAAINAVYVDYAVRGQGEATLLALLDALGGRSGADLAAIDGLTFKRDGTIVHNRDAVFLPPLPHVRLPYEKLGDPGQYLVKTFMGRRTTAHQAAVGCRFRCTFCGVAAVFRGATALPPALRLEQELEYLKNKIGADSLQFYDHNFFDREEDMVPLLEVLARAQMPWWCYARADALLNLSTASWALVRKSGLRMAYIGAETPNDQLLRSIRKGTKADQTLAVAELCRHHGVVPELSFMVGPPNDPLGETERTFDFIRQVKKINPQAEIIIYVYTPVPPSSLPSTRRAKLPPVLDGQGNPVLFPSTPEEWTEKRWVDYSCHADAPWLTDKVRQRIRDFVTVLHCRFPTLQDTRSPPWAKSLLRAAASWRYRFRRYDHPWELDASKSLVRLMDPRVSSL